MGTPHAVQISRRQRLLMHTLAIVTRLTFAFVPTLKWPYRSLQIFDGEEFSRMARLWTNGYDVYTPRRGYIFHDYQNTDVKV